MTRAVFDQPVTERRGVEAINLVAVTLENPGIEMVVGRTKQPRTQGTSHQECERMIARSLRFPVPITASRFDHSRFRPGSGILFCTTTCFTTDLSMPRVACRARARPERASSDTLSDRTILTPIHRQNTAALSRLLRRSSDFTLAGHSLKVGGRVWNGRKKTTRHEARTPDRETELPPSNGRSRVRPATSLAVCRVIEKKMEQSRSLSTLL